MLGSGTNGAKLPTVGLWLNASKSESPQAPGALVGLDSLSPTIPAAPVPGSSAESPSSWDTGRGRKGGRPLAHHARHIRGEPGAKPLVDDMLLDQGLVGGRETLSLPLLKVSPRHKGL